jgi:putative CocE/NonD family hydrolase
MSCADVIFPGPGADNNRRNVSSYPTPARYAVVHRRNVVITADDGTALRADLFLPDAPGERFGAILEMLPYRKDDAASPRLDTHVWFARRGYVGIRLDVRGTGASGGIAEDEYTDAEQIDACTVIAWAAAQPWSNGSVGMWGTSYAGFNSLQVAARRPPALRAVCSHAASADRYGCDCHYAGGALQGIETAVYGTNMLARNALAPARDVADWRDLADQRLSTPAWVETWLTHQLDDDYWRSGSPLTRATQIACPVLLIGGWHDGYVSGQFDLLAHLHAPVKAIVGPWAHARPDSATICGPKADYLPELERFWDRFLNGLSANGWDDEPALRYYRQLGRPVTSYPKLIEGSWHARPSLPGAPTRRLALTSDGLRERDGRPGVRAVAHEPTVGVDAGFWCPASGAMGVSGEQTPDNLRSVCYDAEPQTQPLTLLGAPELDVLVEASHPVAFLTAKLCDVAPDGTSLLITRGWLNLTRAEGYDRARALEPGERMRVRIPLKALSWTLARGHRLRLALTGGDFPTIWPSPFHSTVTVHHGAGQESALLLPVCDGLALAVDLSAEPQLLPEAARVAPANGAWRVARSDFHDIGTVTLGSAQEIEPVGLPWRLTSESHSRFAASDREPAHARLEGRHRFELTGADGCRSVSEGQLLLTSDEEHFYLDARVATRHDDERPQSRTWTRRIPRLLL